MMSETITKYPASYATSGTVNGTRYRNCIGKPSSTTASGNDYASRNSTATITYSFDFSSIPENATIESVEVKVGGHRESATNDNTHKADLALYSGNTAKGEATRFTSTSKQIVTMNAGTWTRGELQNAKLAFTIAYYGGLVNGVDFTVTYSVAVDDRTRIRIKLTDDGDYVVVKKILRKTSDSGAYVQADESAIDKEHIVIMDD